MEAKLRNKSTGLEPSLAQSRGIPSNFPRSHPKVNNREVGPVSTAEDRRNMTSRIAQQKRPIAEGVARKDISQEFARIVSQDQASRGDESNASTSQKRMGSWGASRRTSMSTPWIERLTLRRSGKSVC
jgi:hypothetical protein